MERNLDFGEGNCCIWGRKVLVGSALGVFGYERAMDFCANVAFFNDMPYLMAVPARFWRNPVDLEIMVG